MASRKNGKKGAGDNISLGGFFRINIVNPDGKLVGDSGWKKNVITNAGMQFFLCQLLGGMTGTSNIAYAGLGTGTAAATNATSMVGDLSGSTRKATMTKSYTSRASSGGTGTDASYLRCVGTFVSSIVDTASTIQNIGLFSESAASAVLFAAGTYATSQLSSNQNVNFTYDVRFTAS